MLGKMMREFTDFIAKGNVMDLAVGIIIGAAFTAIVGSLVNDLINPIIGLILGGIDFSNMYVVMKGTVVEGAGLKTARDSGAADRGHQLPDHCSCGVLPGQDDQPGAGRSDQEESASAGSPQGPDRVGRADADPRLAAKMRPRPVAAAMRGGRIWLDLLILALAGPPGMPFA